MMMMMEWQTGEHGISESRAFSCGGQANTANMSIERRSPGHDRLGCRKGLGPSRPTSGGASAAVAVAAFDPTSFAGGFYTEPVLMPPARPLHLPSLSQSSALPSRRAWASICDMASAFSNFHIPHGHVSDQDPPSDGSLLHPPVLLYRERKKRTKSESSSKSPRPFQSSRGSRSMFIASWLTVRTETKTTEQGTRAHKQ
ncbi:hypothetical protein BC826DRAFT_116535 [Russula brevipes]|nr:hypothetical protein BC826DRAFT_116535 [Russula brevipes]